METTEEKNGLLILTRRAGEKVNIGNGSIVLTVKSIRGNRVTVAFEAAKSIPIMRGEIADKVLVTEAVA